MFANLCLRGQAVTMEAVLPQVLALNFPGERIHCAGKVS